MDREHRDQPAEHRDQPAPDQQQPTVRVGVEIPQHLGYGVLRDMAVATEALGFDSVWVRDHLIVSPHEMASFQQGYLRDGRRAVSGRFMSCVPALAAVAAVTERVIVGTDVLNIPRRHPADVANEMAGIDEISGGRLVLQGGIGQPVRDWEPLCIDTPLKVRGQMMEEAIEIIRLLWSSEDPVDFRGEHYQLRQARLGSKPVQSPYPPIWLGVEKTLRRVARLADGFSLMSSMFGGELSRFEDALATVRAEAVKLGRDPNSIVPAARFALVVGHDSEQARKKAEAGWRELWGDDKPWFREWAGDPDHVVGLIAPYIRAGARHIQLWPMPHATAGAMISDLELFASEVLPRLRALSPPLSG